MSLEEDLKKILDDVEAARAAAAVALREFEEEWQRLRASLVRPRFDLAAAYLNDRLAGAKVDFHNGSIVLTVEQNFRLEVSPDKAALEAVFSSSFGDDKPEGFTLSVLDEATVDMKIRQFVQRIADGSPPTSQSGKRQYLGWGRSHS